MRKRHRMIGGVLNSRVGLIRVSVETLGVLAHMAAICRTFPASNWLDFPTPEPAEIFS